ncbi:MAG: hypothetical protein HY736_08290 [Verrucomicrobia bacterium]|nr:hypothetical protein [Verrucomicrobiota bacterium]
MSLFALETKHVSEITPELDRRNGWLYVWTMLLIYFAAPVVYVGVVQAAFCDKLGASATISNLPSATYFLGYVFPFFCSWLFSSRREKAVPQTAFLIVAASMLFVCVVTFLPFPSWLRITVVIGQGVIIGIVNSVNSVYTLRCLGRGTTALGRARALKYAFGLGPIAAVLGSLAAQAVLDDKIPGLRYPYTFGTLYLVALPCMFMCSVLTSRYQLLAVPETRNPPFFRYFAESVRSFGRDRRLVLTWLGYFCWYFTINSMTNISLYTREAVGRAPLELAGLIMAIRFGSKALAGFGLGTMASRYGERVTMITTVVLAGAAIIWPFLASGYGYLFAFGLMGAGELGGVYFLAYILSISAPASATRNLALLGLVGPFSSIAPVIYGGLTDRFGFHASFLFGVVMSGLSLALLLKIKRQRIDPSAAGVRGPGEDAG